MLTSHPIFSLRVELDYSSLYYYGMFSILSNVRCMLYLDIHDLTFRIYRIQLPVNYLLTVNSFLFAFLRWRCCTRAVTGGGPGGPTPYRIYVDSGVVLLCALALAPASPLVSLACLAYFLICAPLIRRNLIFMYRPKFDAGGGRWPFLFDMIISCIIVGAVLMAVQMALKGTYDHIVLSFCFLFASCGVGSLWIRNLAAGGIGPAIVAGLPIIPTSWFHMYITARYKPAYNDAALLQMSLLDGWDTEGATSSQHREEFRRFLVDAHKAAYIPVCIAGPDLEGLITQEPAVVLPLETDIAPIPSQELPFREASINRNGSDTTSDKTVQHGVTLRRAGSSSRALLRQRNASQGTDGSRPQGGDGSFAVAGEEKSEEEEYRSKAP